MIYLVPISVFHSTSCSIYVWGIWPSTR